MSPTHDPPLPLSLPSLPLPLPSHPPQVPFVCGCRDLGEALRRIAEGAAMIRTKVTGARVCEGGYKDCISCAFVCDIGVDIRGCNVLRSCGASW